MREHRFRRSFSYQSQFLSNESTKGGEESHFAMNRVSHSDSLENSAIIRPDYLSPGRCKYREYPFRVVSASSFLRTTISARRDNEGLNYNYYFRRRKLRSSKDSRVIPDPCSGRMADRRRWTTPSSSPSSSSSSWTTWTSSWRSPMLYAEKNLGMAVEPLETSIRTTQVRICALIHRIFTFNINYCVCISLRKIRRDSERRG
ncbi:unnamed protein product [Lasius platythorax]|uniref:Uncharacterized protein n=1 Tax=Lasius platythorax TaxID=488582 RepID=A0AAV2NHJ6_9HYME